MRKKIIKTKNGYTIIETMIAISIFLIVVMIGMGSLLNSTLVQRKSQDMRSIMDNLSFIMEDMSRNLRTGYNYEIGAGGKQISFTASPSAERWVYLIDNSSDSVQKTVGVGPNVVLIPPEIKINSGSGFTVTGTDPADNLQPFVTIRLVGEIDYNGVKTPFSLQTSVSQRLVDI